jgi:hypothetical protein
MPVGTVVHGDGVAENVAADSDVLPVAVGVT